MTTLSSPSDSLFFIYGPPGSGKSTIAGYLAEELSLPFTDLETLIQQEAGSDIPGIFSTEGEAGFRARESRALAAAILKGKGVIALGGGALLSNSNRLLAEQKGQVVCLTAVLDTLIKRLDAEAHERPLLGGGPGWQARLKDLLEKRQEHYGSFAHVLDTTGLSPQESAWQAQILCGAFRVTGMKSEYDIRVSAGSLPALGSALSARGLKGPIALVCDDHLTSLYADSAKNSLENAGYTVTLCPIPSGESHKTLETISELWTQFAAARLERGSTVVALGGGVTCDLAGFAASAFLRGLRWVAVPTSLLAMVDASLGGKTGFDLPAGKNLVGAFHPPSLVLADPQVLNSLPEGEIRSGMAEVIKHGIIADPVLFEMCSKGWEALRGPDDSHPDWTETVRRAMAVKIRVIQIDPYEQGIRASLNLGHTLGHAIEAASNYSLRHGEAVAIGTVAVARLAEQNALCQPGLTAQIQAVFEKLGLPTEIPAGLNPNVYLNALKLDKKRADGQVHFAVPVRIGEVTTGIKLETDFSALLPEAP